MSQTYNRVGAVVGALVVAGALAYGIEMIAGRLHPVPSGINPRDTAAIKAALEAGEVPFPALFMVLSGWLLAAYLGGLLVWRWSRDSGSVWTFAAIFSVLVIINLAILPHPVWMWIGGVFGVPLFALGGGRRTVRID